MKRLSRALVPLASTAKGAYGHDPYGYTPQGTMIPSLYDVPRFAKLDEGEERWMLETQLVRDRNRVADALDDCRRLIDDTLRQAGLTETTAVRILYQLTSPMDKTLGPQEVARRRRVLQSYAGAGVEVAVEPTARGLAAIESAHDAALVVPELIRLAPRAEERGFGAVDHRLLQRSGTRCAARDAAHSGDRAGRRLAASRGAARHAHIAPDAGGARLWARGRAAARARARQRCSPPCAASACR